MIETINTFAWIGANVLVAYDSLVLIIFVVTYYVLYDPKATTAGRMIFRFMLSLVGVIGLVAISTYVDPSHYRVWYEYPDGVSDWRPIARFLVYLYVAFTITSLSVILFVRKWKPNAIAKSSDLDLLRLRNTGAIPLNQDPSNDR